MTTHPNQFPYPSEYAGPVRWFLAGLTAYWWVVLLALVTTWTGMILGLWGALLGGILGAIYGLVDAVIYGAHINSSTTRPIAVITVAVGFVFGALLGASNFVVGELLHPVALAESVAGGAAACILIVAAAAWCEPLIYRLKRYQPPTIDEARTLLPALHEVASQMGLTTVPDLLVYESHQLDISTGLRTIVISEGCISGFTHAELKAVLAHELYHWRRGHAVGLWFVAAAAFPLVALYCVGSYIATGRLPTAAEGAGRRPPSTLRALAGWLIFLPAWVWERYVIRLALMAQSRSYEFQADDAARDIGLAPHLVSALQKMHAGRPERRGWQAALAATHPSPKRRIERLQPRRPDDHLYETDLSWGMGQYLRTVCERVIYGPSRRPVAPRRR